MRPLGTAFLCLPETFLRISLTKSGNGITARLTTKSNFCFSSSARSCLHVTLFNPKAAAISEATFIFLPIESINKN
jgi:hypothetical protein